MDISKKIKDIREEKGIKQYEVAEILGTEKQNYSRLEKRGDKLTIEQLKQIASALGVTIKEILFDEKGSVSEVELENMKMKIALLEKDLEVEKGKYQLVQKISDFAKQELERVSKRDFLKLINDIVPNHVYMRSSMFFYNDQIPADFLSDGNLIDRITYFNLFNYPNTSLLDIIKGFVNEHNLEVISQIKKRVLKLNEKQHKQTLVSLNYLINTLVEFDKQKKVENSKIDEVNKVIRELEFSYNEKSILFGIGTFSIRPYLDDKKNILGIANLQEHIEFFKNIKSNVFPKNNLS